MVNNINTIILSLIYKISSLKTEDDLLKHGVSEILKKLNCLSGAILSFNDFEEKTVIPKTLKKDNYWNETKQLVVKNYQENPFDYLELIHNNLYVYIFRLSKYGLLVLSRNQPFEIRITKELYNLSEYFGKILLNVIFDSEKNAKDKIINNQIDLQNILIKISTEYINADLNNLDTLINKSLEQIGKFVQADRSYIFSYNFENQTTNNTYEWCNDGIEPEIDNLQNIPIHYINQWLEAHQKGQAFYVEDVSSLPLDGEFGLRAILEPQGIKSLIAIPKIKNKKLIGFVGFDAVKNIKKFSDSEKNILFVFANMLVNIIQRKENEEHIKEQEKKKEELLKNLEINNQELNDYAHVVSHDLKAPLRNIDTLVNWVIEDNKGKMQENCLKSLNEVLFNVEKMDLLIKGILDYSTIDKLVAEDRLVNINQLIDEIIRTLHIPKHIKIQTPENLPKVYGNAWRFKQVFQNLIQNAINYNDKELGVIEIGYEILNEKFQFFIKDNGIGIASKYHDRIFKVFTKLENNNQSSGIGLSIVKKIILFYNGDIWIDSQEKIGTTFFFTLPKS